MSGNRDAAARTLIKDQTIREAFEDVKADLVSTLLNGATPEIRERIFQEHQAVSRVFQKLEAWAVNKLLEETQ